MNRSEKIGKQLDHTGLNLHAVFDLSALPEEMKTELTALYPDLSDYRQLILFGHGGQTLWQNTQSSMGNNKHPIDTYSIKIISAFCEQHKTISTFKIIYPSEKPVGLQSLGMLAGWHNESPFRVGINQRWGSWFAYRVAVLTNSDFQTTEKWEDESPCLSCNDKPCVSACPADALGDDFSLRRCIDYRKAPNSLCKDRCIARMACPIAAEHRYPLEQIQYHYGISLEMIKKLEL